VSEFGPLFLYLLSSFTIAMQGGGEREKKQKRGLPLQEEKKKEERATRRLS